MLIASTGMRPSQDLFPAFDAETGRIYWFSSRWERENRLDFDVCDTYFAIQHICAYVTYVARQCMAGTPVLTEKDSEECYITVAEIIFGNCHKDLDGFDLVGTIQQALSYARMNDGTLDWEVFSYNI